MQKIESTLVMVTLSAINIIDRCRNHPKNRTNQLTITSVIIEQVKKETGKIKSTLVMIIASVMKTVDRCERKNHHSS